jgi:hypothetical protein
VRVSPRRVSQLRKQVCCRRSLYNLITYYDTSEYIEHICLNASKLHRKSAGLILRLQGCVYTHTHTHTPDANPSCCLRVLRCCCREQVIVRAAEPPQTDTDTDYYAPGSGKVPPPSEGSDNYDVSLPHPRTHITVPAPQHVHTAFPFMHSADDQTSSTFTAPISTKLQPAPMGIHKPDLSSPCSLQLLPHRCTSTSPWV